MVSFRSWFNVLELLFVKMYEWPLLGPPTNTWPETILLTKMKKLQCSFQKNCSIQRRCWANDSHFFNSFNSFGIKSNSFSLFSDYQIKIDSFRVIGLINDKTQYVKQSIFPIKDANDTRNYQHTNYAKVQTSKILDMQIWKHTNECIVNRLHQTLP